MQLYICKKRGHTDFAKCRARNCGVRSVDCWTAVREERIERLIENLPYYWICSAVRETNFLIR